jgi:hypothetical protein
LRCSTKRLGTKEAEMRIVGCDLHARQQYIAMVDTESGELTEKIVRHEGNAVREFYAALESPIVVGIEATSTANQAASPLRGVASSSYSAVNQLLKSVVR